MNADVVAAVACGAATGASCWLIFAFERGEVQAAFAAVRTVATAEAGLLLGIVHAVAECFGAFASLQREGGPVGLGEVSEMIDIVRLGLSAGLSFDAALGLYCAERASPLASCMAQARLSWQTGLKTRAEALSDAAQGTGVHAMEAFAMAVGQALELGAPLAETLAGQSKEIRAAHRAEVERQIERAPVKLLIPTGTLILPALLVSIIGPLLAAGGML